MVRGYLQQVGVHLLQCLDVWLAHAKSRELTAYHTGWVVEFARQLGFLINVEKSELAPTQDLVYLGYRFSASTGSDYGSRVPLMQAAEVNSYLPTVSQSASSSVAISFECVSFHGRAGISGCAPCSGRSGDRVPDRQGIRWLLHCRSWRRCAGGRIQQMHPSRNGGGASGPRESAWFLVHGRIDTAHQCLRYVGCVPGAATFQTADARPCRLDSYGQFDRCQLCSASRRNEITHTAGSRFESVCMARRPRGDAEVQILPTVWSLHPKIVDRWWQTWERPTVDLFATHLNKKMEGYVSPMPDPGAFAVDALSIYWTGLMGLLIRPQPSSAKLSGRFSRWIA